MLYYKKRLSGGESKDIRLNDHEPDEGSDRSMPGKIRITLVGILRNKNCLPKEEANGI